MSRNRYHKVKKKLHSGDEMSKISRHAESKFVQLGIFHKLYVLANLRYLSWPARGEKVYQRKTD